MKFRCILINLVFASAFFGTVWLKCVNESDSCNESQKELAKYGFGDDTNNNENDSFTIHQEAILPVFKRIKRKVIPRGGHYILRGKSGGGWGSSRMASSGYDWKTGMKKSKNKKKTSSNKLIARRNRNRNLILFPQNTPYSSQTARKVDTLKKVKERKKRIRISKMLKDEIAQYAMRHGPKNTAKRYEKDLGRKLREKAIMKFVARYKKRKIKGKQ